MSKIEKSSCKGPAGAKLNLEGVCANMMKRKRQTGIQFALASFLTETLVFCMCCLCFFFFLKGNCPVYLQYMYMYMLKLLIDPTHFFLLPSGNQTCQWKITHLYTNYVPIKTSFYRGFNIATFDYRRVCPLFPIILGELWWPHVMSRRETAIFRLVHNYDSAKIPVISLLFLYLYIIYICISHFLHHWLI